MNLKKDFLETFGKEDVSFLKRATGRKISSPFLLDMNEETGGSKAASSYHANMQGVSLG